MSDKLPPGVTSALTIDMDIEGDKDAKYLVCQTVKDGPPNAKPTSQTEMVLCSRCSYECWKARIAPNNMTILCVDCMDKVAPDWRGKIAMVAGRQN